MYFVFIVIIQICCTASTPNTTEMKVGCILTASPVDDNRWCEIFCDVLSEVLVDDALDSIGQCFVFLLTLGNFENWTVNGDWYRGGIGRDVENLRITNCSFLQIESDAFSSKPLTKLRKLAFHNIKSIRFSSGWAYGLAFVAIIFENAMVDELQYDFLHATSAQKLTMYSSFGNYNIMNIFEEGRRSLEILNITNAPAIRRISGMHLFGAIWLRLLILNNCSIEAIAENAFLSTRFLGRLELKGNHLKTLPAIVFNFLLQRRYLQDLILKNNTWECSCELLTVRDQLTVYEFVFDDFPKNCPLTGITEPNGSYVRGKDCIESENILIRKYKSCEMEIGLNTIFVRYPKFILKADISLNNLLIKSLTEKNNEYYCFTPNHREFSKWIHKSNKCSEYPSIACSFFRNQTESFPLNIFHGQKPRTFCVLDSVAKTGIWPYNCISICKGCDEISDVWLHIPSILWAAIISVIVGLACISIGMALGFLLLRLNPKFLRGLEKVVFLQNTAAGRKHSCTIFVMPSDWRPIERFSADISRVYEYAEFEPPLPPRPKFRCQSSQSMTELYESIKYEEIN